MNTVVRQCGTCQWFDTTLTTAEAATAARWALSEAGICRFVLPSLPLYVTLEDADGVWRGELRLVMPHLTHCQTWKKRKL